MNEKSKDNFIYYDTQIKQVENKSILYINPRPQSVDMLYIFSLQHIIICHNIDFIVLHPRCPGLENINKNIKESSLISHTRILLLLVIFNRKLPL